jgi:hypothetical protein
MKTEINYIENIKASFYDKQYAQAKAEIKIAIENGIDPRQINEADEAFNVFFKNIAISILSNKKNRKARLTYINQEI